MYEIQDVAIYNKIKGGTHNSTSINIYIYKDVNAKKDYKVIYNWGVPNI